MKKQIFSKFFFTVLTIILIQLTSVAQTVDSVFYYNENGQEEWWYIQKDVYAFRTVNGLPYNGNDANMSVVDQKYHQPNTTRKLNIMEFKPIATSPQRDTEKNKVRTKPIFECEFPVITKEKTLDKSFNKWKTVDDYILIVFRDSYISQNDVSAFAIRNDLILVHQPSNQLPQDYSWTYIFRLGPSKCGSGDPITVAKEIFVTESAIVKISEPNIRAFTPNGCTTVNEMQLVTSQLNRLWQLNNTGQVILNGQSGTADADADICECWGDGYNGNGIKVGVIDFYGFEFDHEDITGKFVSGWDCVDNPVTQINNTTIHESTDAHAMMTSGIIAANTNNNTGIAGVAYGASLIPYLISGSSSEIVRALQKAIPDGADVINMSFTGLTSTDAVHNDIINLTNIGRPDQWNPAIKYGMVFVASAGNSNDGSDPKYPAAWPEVIGVGASNPNDYRGVDGDGWGFWGLGGGSNYGPFYDVVAPGSDITSLDYMGGIGYNTTNYAIESATSLATPVVSGIAAILLSKNKGLYWHEVKSTIISGAEKVNPSTYNYYYDIADPGRSLEMQYGRVSCINSLQSVTVGIEEIEQTPIDITFFNSGDNELTIYYNLNGKEKEVSLLIYDAIGRQVSSTVLEEQVHQATVSTLELNSGIYFMGFYSKQHGLIKSHKFFK